MLGVKRMRRVSHTSRSLELLASLGCELVDECQRRVAYSVGDGRFGHTVDLFGVADIIGVIPGERFVLVQVCSYSGVPAHKKKLLGLSDRLSIILSVADFEIWGWDQPGGPGTRWFCKRWRAARGPSGEIYFEKL